MSSFRGAGKGVYPLGHMLGTSESIKVAIFSQILKKSVSQYISHIKSQYRVKEDFLELMRASRPPPIDESIKAATN
jgi:hypothetical protein